MCNSITSISKSVAASVCHRALYSISSSPPGLLLFRTVDVLVGLGTTVYNTFGIAGLWSTFEFGSTNCEGKR